MEELVIFEFSIFNSVEPAGKMAVPAVALVEITAEEVAVGVEEPMATIKFAESVAIFILPIFATSASKVGVFRRLAMREPLKAASVPASLALMVTDPSSETISLELRKLMAPIPEGWIKRVPAVVSILLSLIAI